MALEGSMRALMAAAAGLLARNPVQDSRHHWWRQVLARARSMAVHSVPQDARQVQFHYDLSDDFYALLAGPAQGVFVCLFSRPLLERQFRRVFAIAKRERGVTGERFLQLLETRLDSVVYLLGLAKSRAAARQFVNHGHIRVNGKKVRTPTRGRGA